VTDEGGYWGIWDQQALRDTWARYAAALAALSDPVALQQLLEEAGLNMLQVRGFAAEVTARRVPRADGRRHIARPTDPGHAPGFTPAGHPQ